MNAFDWFGKKKAKIDEHPDALSPFYSIMMLGCLIVAILCVLGAIAVFIIPFF